MISSIRGFYEGIIRTGDSFQNVLLFLMRLYWGFAFYQSGMGKLNDLPKFVGYLESLNIPFAEVSAYAAAFTETVGGLLLMVGFASRLVVMPLAVVMCVAYVTAHRAACLNVFQDPAAFISQPPFNFLLTCLIVFAFGPGKCSIDYCFESKK